MMHTPQSGDAVHAEILAFQPEIIASALKLSGDAGEAQRLADLTLARALESARPDQDRDLRVWLFSLLRAVFHSVERQRSVRRDRGYTVTARLAAPEAQA